MIGSIGLFIAVRLLQPAVGQEPAGTNQVQWSVDGEQAPYYFAVHTFFSMFRKDVEGNERHRGRWLAEMGIAELSEAAGLLDAAAEGWRVAFDQVPSPPDAGQSIDPVKSDLQSLERFEKRVALQRRVWEGFLADWRSIGEDPCVVKRYIAEHVRPSFSVGSSSLPQHRQRAEAAMASMDDLDDVERECGSIVDESAPASPARP